ncbi:hypothetical protein FEM48_Zijuj03G0154800 [Ziziphus jujuba var. spinosa]|uniref:Disease resistance R13L4/SHOC-2-like LRR domain-containing protein n=1 Tax=Ziziphus jujuba var. spinosa TaxID=714518 RepID=A0A978VR43_ZIZJJ|nr:hypothetical protein FEM48_Zijuj03G0154800 [Ziziphus jujuba var. spinosa]
MTFMTLPIAWPRGLMVRTAVITGHVQKFLLRRPYPLSENYFGVPKMALLVDFSMNKLSGEIPPNLQRRWHNPPNLRTKPRNEDDDNGMSWFYLGMGVGFAMGFCGVCRTLFFNRTWRHNCFQFLDLVKDSIYVASSLKFDMCIYHGFNTYEHLQSSAEHPSADRSNSKCLGNVFLHLNFEGNDLRIKVMSYVNLSRASDWLEVTNSLPSLTVLHLSSCLLNFNVPLPYHVNFSSLAVLDLSFNYFYGGSRSPSRQGIPEWIPNLRSLASLDLSNAAYGSPIPEGIQNLTSLVHLDLSYNNFNTSSIPSWLYKMSHLNFLNLGYNYLGGTISSHITNLTSISMLDLSNNDLEGKLPTSMGTRLCNLKEIHLSGNKWNQSMSQMLDSLSGCVSSNLEVLSILHGQIYGQLTNQIGQFKTLTRLVLSENMISGPIPVSLGNLLSLRYLSLGSNHLNETLPVSFGQLAKLEYLDIYGNEYMEGVVSEAHFANSTRLRELEAGRIPEQLCALSALQLLDVAHNNLSGYIPKCVCNFSSMVGGDDYRGFLYTVNGSTSFFKEDALLVMKGQEMEYIENLVYVNSIDLSGTQLQSFDASSYVGNSLCGPPLTPNCSRDVVTPTAENKNRNEDDDNVMSWFYLGMGVGFAIGFWGVCGGLFFNRTWRHNYFRFLDRMKDSIYVKTSETTFKISESLKGIIFCKAFVFAVGLWGFSSALLFNRTWRHNYFQPLDQMKDTLYVTSSLKLRWFHEKFGTYSYNQ